MQWRTPPRGRGCEAGGVGCEARPGEPGHVRWQRGYQFRFRWRDERGDVRNVRSRDIAIEGYPRGP